MTRLDNNDEKVKNVCRELPYRHRWDISSSNKQIKEVLNRASKTGSGNAGFPDYINVDEGEKLLVIVEIKDAIAKHRSASDFPEPSEYAVDGTVWYLERFLDTNLRDARLREYFRDWKLVGVAVSGDIEEEYNHSISTFIVKEQLVVEQPQITDLRSEEDYLAIFETFKEEDLIARVSASSKRLNKWLRSIDSQKRPVLLSALMICLFKIESRGADNSFINEYNSNTPATIVKKIESRVSDVLNSEGIPANKIDVLLDELRFIHHDNDLNHTEIIKDILNELRDVIIPLFNRQSNYDIIGKFYEDFLRWAGVANVKKGIVLTPSHITDLFTELIEMKSNDVVLDIGCGTGAFLIAAMNKLISTIQNSGMHGKEQKIAHIKQEQLIGFETNPLMYSLAISSMLFRGDGKSQIYNVDSFSDQANNILSELKRKGISPSIGFINPPYGGRDTDDNPTKREIQFITRLLDLCSRYVVVIAPLSTYFKDELIRNRILENHRLKLVINMPKDLFMPNASTNTAVAVFQTNQPQENHKVTFYDLKDDGYVLSKSKGRTDLYGKWKTIKKDLLNKLDSPELYSDGINLVHTEIKKGDEWLIQDHSVIDYSTLSAHSFEQSIKNYLVFKAKENMGILGKEVDEIVLLDMLSSFYADME